MTTAEDGKGAGKVSYCEYSKTVTGIGEFELSVRECGDETCPLSIFSNPSIYEGCPRRLKFKKEGGPVSQTEPKKVFVRVHSKIESVPKFTGIACNGCQFKAGSYCWGQCTFNIWKRKPDW
ncbi:MAG: hypothetical protein ABSF44_13105 [Candidatus Bathyarchaeia archaeon]|jgi:hypothetical protein